LGFGSLEFCFDAFVPDNGREERGEFAAISIVESTIARQWQSCRVAGQRLDSRQLQFPADFEGTAIQQRATLL